MPEPGPERRADFMLLLNTCGNPGEVGLAHLPMLQEGTASLTVRSLPGRQTQECLLSEMASLLEACRIGPGDIGAIAVVNGPGSFTGVRVGLAAAMGLAEALHIPVIPISRLALLEAQAQDGALVEAWLQAGRGDVFRGRYRQGECLDETMLRADDALAGLSSGEIVVMEEELLSLSPHLRLVPPVGVQQALPIALCKLQAGEVADPAGVRANYLRVPDAELARLSRERTAQASA